MYVFAIFIHNEFNGPYFLLHVVPTIFASDLPKDCWISSNFVGTMIFFFILELARTCKWPMKTNVDNNELKCPQHQRWFEIPSSLEYSPGQ